MYRLQEQEKKRTYNQKVHENEHGSFTPLVMFIAKGMIANWDAESFMPCWQG